MYATGGAHAVPGGQGVPVSTHRLGTTTTPAAACVEPVQRVAGEYRQRTHGERWSLKASGTLQLRQPPLLNDDKQYSSLAFANATYAGGDD